MSTVSDIGSSALTVLYGGNISASISASISLYPIGNFSLYSLQSYWDNNTDAIQK